MRKRYFLLFASLFLSIGVFSQENAYSSFDVSLRNSIKFNKFLLNPAFSFARESSPTITLVNRRQWVKFENSPQLYFANYLGSLGNNSRFGIGVYQQNLGLLKNFGGVLNYAYNIPVGLESNLTFGINTYFYNSTFDFGKVITVVEEPLLQNQKSNSLIAIKPGINLGTEFFDFGVSVNNLVLYNLATSEMVKDNQENSYLGYVMYTGYVNSYRGFLEDAKFSTLVFAENNKDATALSANFLLDIPNKAWLQGGYNTLYGFSAGVGITLSEKFSLGYNYDIGLGDVSQLGSSHEFLLSYKFDEYEESNRYYQQVTKKPKATTKKAPTTPAKTKEQIAKEKADQLANAKLERERLVREAAEKAERDRLAAEEEARLKAEQSKENVNSQAEKDRLAAEETARKKAAEDKAIADAAAKAKAERDRIAAEAEARRKAANDKARADAERAKAERDRLAREATAQSQAEKDKLAAEESARKKAAEDKANADAATRAQAEKDRLAAEELARKKAAEDKANADAAIRAQAEKDRLAAEELARKKAAEDKSNADAAAKAQAEKDRLVAEEAKRKQIESDASNRAVEAFKKDIELKTAASDRLTKSIDSIVKDRDNDLKEFLLENTLNADGTARAPRKFVSTAESNAQIQSLKSKISANKFAFDKLIRDFEASNNQRIKELKAKGISDADAKSVNDYYLKMLNDLKQKRDAFNKLEQEADARIQRIKEEKEAERLRRIKKAEFLDETERNLTNQQYLEALKKNQGVVNGNNPTGGVAPVSDSNTDPNAVTDIPIIKKLKDVSSGYYLVLEKFSNIDETKAYLATVLKEGGGSNVNFFYNLHNSTYYVYISKAESMTNANQELKAKGTKTYNKNMFIVKVE